MTALSLLLMAMFSKVSLATPVNIGQVGPTTPVTSIVKTSLIKSQVVRQIQGSNISKIASVEKPKTLQWVHYPLKSGLTPGKVTSRNVQLTWLTQPLFLIGSGQQSVTWLARYRSRLKSHHAIGLLVEAYSKADYKRMLKLADGLMLLPVSARQIIKRTNIKHYPVLISLHLIEQ